MPGSEKKSEGSSHKSSKTTSATRKQLEDLKRQIAELRAQTGRRSLNAETAYKRLTPSEKKFQDDQREKKKRVKDIHTAAQKVDLLFLVDCTGSMSPYITEIKAKIQMIISLTKESFEKLTVRLCFVGYRDFCDGDKRFTVSPFSSDVGKFKTHLSKVMADGGGDAPEDIFGGIDKAMKQAWEQPTRIMIHIADAPCHGSQFHTQKLTDDHPLDKDGLDKSGLSARDVLSKVEEKKVKYWFHHVREAETRKMLSEFNAIGKDVGFTISETDLKEDVKALVKHVIRSLMSSITGSISKLVKMGSAADCIGRPRAQLVVERPRWAGIREENALEQHPNLPKSVEDILKGSEQAKRQNLVKIKLAPHPFAQGELRDAYYGLEIVEGKEPKDIVLKRFDMNRKGAQSVYDYEVQMEIQSVASFLARRFNTKKRSLGLKCKDIKFLEVRTVQLIDRPEAFCANIEPFIQDFEKYNSNYGYVADGMHNEIQAFSHWTFQISDQSLIVVDIQGMKTDDGYYVTDPAMHSRDTTRFGGTNLDIGGFTAFFATHECNDICRALKLPSNTIIRPPSARNRTETLV